MKRNQSSFRGKVNQDAKRQKSARSNYGYLNLPKGVTMFKEEPGSRIKIDILPYLVTADNHPDRDEKAEIAIPNTLWYKRPFKIHRNVGANNDTVVCPTSIGKKCPICDYRSKRLKEGAEKDETNAMKPSARNLYAIIPLDSEKFEKKIHVWDISQFLFQNLLNEELEENGDNAIFPDLEEGLSLRIRFDSSTVGTSKAFAEASRIDFVERKKPYAEDILEDVPNLDELLTILSFKEIEAKFFEVEDEPEEEDKPIYRKVEKEEEEDKPVRRKRPEPEEEEEEDDKPARSRKSESKEKSTSKNECPFNHQFGTDCEKFNDCDECTLWEKCIEEKDKKR